MMLLVFLCTNVLFLPGLQGTSQAFSVGEEREVGEKLLSVVRKEFKLLDDPDITQYITNLGQSILKVSGPQYFDYHFFVINNKEFNAFAAPSGLIFFHTGLIETMDTEDELASVMAHEIGHVESRHIAERIKKSSKVGLGTLAMVLAGIAIGAGPVSDALITGSMAAGTAMNLSFSRQDEEEADRLAFKWLIASKRDPNAMTDMLRKMYRVSRLRRDMVPPYLMTHPDPAQRLNYVQDLLLTDKTSNRQSTNNFAFQRFKYRILSQTKDTTTLIAKYRREIREITSPNAETIMPFYGLSLAQASNADYANARSSLEKVIKFYPDQAILICDMGVLRFQEGDYKEALKLFQSARQSEPDNAYNTYYLAKTHEQLGDKKMALQLYQELLPVLPDYSRLHYNIGQILAADGKSGEGHYHLGIFFWQEGDAKNAIFHLQKASQELPADNPLHNDAIAQIAKIQQLEKQ